MARTAGSSRSLGLIAGLVAAVLVQPMACGPGGSGTGGATAEAIRAVLADTWPLVLEPTLADVSAQAAALEAATAAWAEAEASGGDGIAAREVAQQAWFRTMDAWQEAELMQLGPGASALTAVAGEDRRDAIYSWPTTNPCRVDQETAEEGWTAPDYFEVELVNVMGLDALETVLFSADEANACPPQVAINADGTWTALGPDGVRALRADQAHALASQLVVEVDGLIAAWDPAEGDFAGALAKAGEGTSPYASPEEGLNAVFDALFYIQSKSKNKKLGEPLGLQDCGATDCLPGVETRLAGGSDAWLRANLAGFEHLFRGGEGQGLDDLLRDLGEDAAADAVDAALADAVIAADALQKPVDEAVTTDPAEAEALYHALDVLSDTLKSDVATALLLQVPAEAAGDND